MIKSYRYLLKLLYLVLVMAGVFYFLFFFFGRTETIHFTHSLLTYTSTNRMAPKYLISLAGSYSFSSMVGQFTCQSDALA